MTIERKVHYIGPDDRWPACGRLGHVETTAEVAGVTCGQCHRRLGTGPTLRISCELPTALVERLERQAEAMACSRRFLIESAVLAMVKEFEAIDQDEATR